MKRPALTAFEQEALAVLELVNARAEKLYAAGPWDYMLVCEFHTASGWKFAVFVDAGSWDYLEGIEAPDGRSWSYVDGWDRKTEDESELLQDWSPTDDAVWTDAEVQK